MKGSGRTILFMTPFLLAGIGFIYAATQANPTDLTDDGYSLKNFFFMMGGGAIFIPFALVIGGAIHARIKRNRIEGLLETGKQGTAVVLELRDTGVRANDNPRVDMLLEISIEGFAPYKARKKITVPLINLPQVQVGATIGVLADPHDPANQKRIALLLR